MLKSSRECELSRIFYFLIPLAFLLFVKANAGIAITPKFIFTNQSKSSAVINVSNNGEAEEEVWVDFVFGYVISDDSGRIKVYIDSSNTDELSITPFLQAYPKRFILGPGESQTIRISVKSPTEKLDGEYWSRILVNSKPRKVITAVNDTLRVRSGLSFITQQSIPFHYRKGNVSTGVSISDLVGNVKDSLLIISMKLTRVGNAAFWGTRNVKVFNENGKLISSIQKNLVVYKTLTQIDNIRLQDLPPGRYTVQVECVTTRTDIKKIEIVPALMSRESVSVTIP